MDRKLPRKTIRFSESPAPSEAARSWLKLIPSLSLWTSLFDLPLDMLTLQHRGDAIKRQKGDKDHYFRNVDEFRNLSRWIDNREKIAGKYPPTSKKSMNA